MVQRDHRFVIKPKKVLRQDQILTAFMENAYILIQLFLLQMDLLKQ